MEIKDILAQFVYEQDYSIEKDALIKCCRCKRKYKKVNYSGNEDDYKQEKWFCDFCWGYQKSHEEFLRFLEMCVDNRHQAKKDINQKKLF
jgi:hypothetical protein